MEEVLEVFFWGNVVGLVFLDIFLFNIIGFCFIKSIILIFFFDICVLGYFYFESYFFFFKLFF